jgi:hypothetical protein
VKMSHKSTPLPFKKGDTVVVKLIRSEPSRKWRYATRKIARINRTENIGVLGGSSVRVLPDLSIDGCKEHGCLKAVEIPTPDLMRSVRRHTAIEWISDVLDDHRVSDDVIFSICASLQKEINRNG